MRKYRKVLAALMCSALVFSAGYPERAFAADMDQKENQTQEEVQSQSDQAEEGTDEEKGKELPKLQLTFGEGQERPAYDPGTTGKLEISVKNNTDKLIKNVVIKPKNEKNWPFDTGKMNSTQKLGDIEAGKEAVLTYEKVTIPVNAESGHYELKFAATYEDEEGKSYTVSQNVFIRINEKAPEPEPEPTPEPTPDPGIDMNPGGSIGGGSGAEASNSVPRVIVTGFSTEPAVVKAGTDFKLIIHLKNTSKETYVKNLLFDLEAPTEGSDAATASPAFLPASGSNSIYLDKIKANGTQDISIMLNAKSDLVQKPYSINIGMKYENKDGGQFDSNASVSIPIKQDARFEFSEFELSSDYIEVGSEANVMCNLYNLGRTKLYNVKVNFEGEGISCTEQFLGNVESGATASVDNMLLGEAVTTGDGTVKMIMSYEDEEGVATTFEKTFTMFVTEPVVQDMGMMEPSEPVEEEKKFPVVPVVIGVVAAAGIITAIIVMKKRKKRRLEEEEAGLVDEFDRLTEDERR